MGGFIMKASSPNLIRQLTVPLVQKAAWWPSCAGQKGGTARQGEGRVERVRGCSSDNTNLSADVAAVDG